MNSTFDQASLCVVDGRLKELQVLLDAHPDLVHRVSEDSFGTTLLHYVAANGIPDALQRTPTNAVGVCEALLAAGADPNALSKGYRGGPNSTPLCLLVSSYHPFAAGLQSDLIRTLVAGGASVEGELQDGAPLATALVFGYLRAAETLVDVGARVENLYFAAGTGRLAGVQGFFDEEGRLKPDAEGTYAPPVPREPHDNPQAIVQEAFHFAISHRRLQVASWLLGKGADVNSATKGHHCERPLVQAVFLECPEAAEFLLEKGADPDCVDGKRRLSARQHVAKHGIPSLRRLLGEELPGEG